MPGLTEEERERLKGKYKPVQRRLKASSRAYPLSKTMRMLSSGSTNRLDQDANKLSIAIKVINDLAQDLSIKDEKTGRYPEMTADNLKLLNEKYAEALKACSVLINADYLSDEEKSKPKYQTYKDMAEKMQIFLSSDYKYLDTANAKMGQTLPEILSGARQIVLKAPQVKFDTVGAAQSSRHPVTVKLPGGKKVKGMFTEKDDFNPVKDFNELLETLRVDPSLNRIIDRIKFPEDSQDASSVNTRISMARKDAYAYIVAANYKKAVETAVANGAKREDLKPKDEVQACIARGVTPRSFFASLAENTKYWVHHQPEGLEMETYLDAHPEVFERMMQAFSANSEKLSTKMDINFLKIGMTGGNLDTKNAACSVFASLLGRPDLLCNSTPVKMEKADGTVVEGTLMEYAEGLSIGNVGSDRKDPANKRYYEFSVTDGISKRPVQKDIFDLEIMDYALGNVDPHGNNIIYDVQWDEMEYVLKGLKRIDLDNTFCINKIGNPGTHNLAHISRLHAISADMAARIESLTKDTLAMALRGFMQSDKNPGGLTQAAIDAAWERIEDIKSHIDHGITEPTDGKLLVLQDSDWKKFTMDQLKTTYIDKNAPNGTSADICAWFSAKSKEEISVQAAKKEAEAAAKNKAKGFTFQEAPAAFTAKNGKEISYTKMEDALNKVVQGLDAVADVWFGSKQYKKMRTQAKNVQAMLHEYNTADPEAPKDPDFKQKLDDELLTFMDKTEDYFKRKRDQGQKAANNENSMKRIKAAADAADFVAKYVNKSENKKEDDKQKESSPML